MLSKKNRIHTRFEFDKIRKFGESRRYKYFYLHVLSIKRLTEISNGRWDIGGQTQVGLIVSRKFHKHAVVRNRVKRLLRASVRQNFDKIPQGWWLVFYPKSVCLLADYEKINTEVTEALQKISFSGKVWSKDLPF